MTQKYVVGFAFWRDQVLLIHKTKGPSYVVGKLNGIGGKIEQDEAVDSAMSREFMEETGVETWPSAWTHRAVMVGNANEGNDYELHVLINFLPDVTDFQAIRNPESSGETISWYEMSTLGRQQTVENLDWLIPMCLDSSTPFLRIQEN